MWPTQEQVQMGTSSPRRISRNQASSPQLLCSLSRTSSQAKFLLMLSGYWKYACYYGYPRCLGSLVVQLAMCGTVLLAYACRCNMMRLKGDTMPFHAFWVVYTKSWIVMRARALSDPSESKSAPLSTFRSWYGSHWQHSSTCSRRMSLKMCFERITFSVLCEQWMQFVFPGQQRSFTTCLFVPVISVTNVL